MYRQWGNNSTIYQTFVLRDTHHRRRARMDGTPRRAGTRTRARERVREERSIVYTHPIVRLETRERLLPRARENTDSVGRRGEPNNQSINRFDDTRVDRSETIRTSP